VTLKVTVPALTDDEDRLNLYSDGLPAVTVTLLAAVAAAGSATPAPATDAQTKNIATRLLFNIDSSPRVQLDFDRAER
jgi:hypothetical protein